MALQETEGLFRSRRGYDLFTIQLVPSTIRAIIVYHHGFGEHCSRHLNVLRELATKLGALVITYDAHGHGRSGPFTPQLRAYVANWRHLLEDLLDVLDQVALPAAAAKGIPEGKIFLMGHSMGGMTSMLAGMERPQLGGLILTSPFVSVTPLNSWGEWTQIAMLRLLNLFIPAKPFLKRRTIEAGVRDPEGIKIIQADTLWYRDKIKVRTIVSCINATLVIQAKAGRITLPIYVQQGTLDKTCSVVALRRLLPTLGSKQVTYHEVEGALHDLLFDLETPACVKRIIDFVNSIVSPE